VLLVHRTAQAHADRRAGAAGAGPGRGVQHEPAVGPRHRGGPRPRRGA
jgi:hypothetical protein